MRGFLVVMIAASAALALSWSIAGKPAAAQVAPACWLVFWLSTGEAPGDVPDEIICLDNETSARVRESSIFGTMVETCNAVTVSRGGENLTLLVDYSTCPSETPTHTIACPSATGDRLKCSWTYTYAGALETGDVYLVREVE
jgi:hypothetical protein